MTSPPVFIVDTNAAVAGLITTPGASPVVAILDAMLSGRLFYLLSPELLQEYRTVLLRPKIAKLHGLGEMELDDVLTELTANAIWREPHRSAPAPDRGDDHLWALLGAHESSILITGDRLLQANPPPNVHVISPATWLETFAR
ncbi:MAG: putative toxin-antitoxin system toxin component, PIN family [Gammaproteobacteria bacterium]